MGLTLEQLKDKYFLRTQDLPHRSRLPMDHDGSVATSLVDGESYFKAVNEAIKDLKGKTHTVGGKVYRDFVYIANWKFQSSLGLPLPRSPKNLAMLLDEKGRAGVDVRVLLWFGPWSVPDAQSEMYRSLVKRPYIGTLLDKKAEGFPHRGTVLENAISARVLRSKTALKNNVLLDYGAHPFGSHHMKTVAVYDATADKVTAFCGGIDLAWGRWAQTGHQIESPLKFPAPTEPAPTITDGGPGELPGGTYEVLEVYFKKSGGQWDLKSVSNVASIALPPNRKIKVNIWPSEEGIILARWVGQHDLPRQAVQLHEKDTVLAVEINTDPLTWPPYTPGVDWHDVMVKVEGQAAGTIAKFIGLRWNDVLNYPPLRWYFPGEPGKLTYVNPPGPTPIPPIDDAIRSVPVRSGKQSLQVLMTVADIALPLKLLFRTPQQYSFAPNGEHTVYYAYKKAINAATKYIYIEDQCMWSSEIMGLIADRMTGLGGAPDLKVILVTSGVIDPDDVKFKENYNLERNDSIWDGLIDELPASMKGNVRFFMSSGLIIHSKLMVIDDEWAAIGSANMADRSLSTDTEMQLSIVDETGAFAKDLRKKLWAEHLNIAVGSSLYTALDNIDHALWMWHNLNDSSGPAWGTDPGVPFFTPRRAAEIALPLPASYPSPGLKWIELLLTDWTTESF